MAKEEVPCSTAPKGSAGFASPRVVLVTSCESAWISFDDRRLTYFWLALFSYAWLRAAWVRVVFNLLGLALLRLTGTWPLGGGGT